MGVAIGEGETLRLGGEGTAGGEEDCRWGGGGGGGGRRTAEAMGTCSHFHTAILTAVFWLVVQKLRRESVHARTFLMGILN